MGKIASKKSGERLPKPVVAWAWAVREGGRWVLYPWANESRESLLWDGQPSGECKPIRVRLVPIEGGKKR